MAGFRIPGPLGFNAGDPPIDDGTLCRQASLPPGTVSHIHRPKQTRRDSRLQKPKAPVLREYDRGPRVAQLQKMLNKCVVPPPRLSIDGMFGSSTKQAVRDFQAAARLYVDGTVSATTWHALFQTLEKTHGAAVASAGSVAEWPLQRKLMAVVTRLPSKLPGEFAVQLSGMIRFSNLAQLLALLVVSHLLGVGEVMDVVLVLAIGYSGLHDLLDALITATYATSDADLDKAATELSRVIIDVGVIVFVHAISKVSKAEAGGAGATEPAKPGVPKIEAPKPRVPTAKPVKTQVAQSAEGGRPANPTPTDSVLSKDEPSQLARGPENIQNTASHYTSSKWAKAIQQEGLRPGTYATPNGTLSGLQAQLELALPPDRSLPNVRIRIDLQGLREAGYEIPTVSRVSSTVKGLDGRVYQMPGGGYEMKFPYQIPAKYLEVLPIQ